MQYDWLSDYCLEKPGAVKEWKEDWGVFRYLVGGKMFLMDGEDNTGRKIITLRLDPLRGDEERLRFCGDVMPGYYMNKVHWNSIDRTGGVPDGVLKNMIDESYSIILSGLTKKMQSAIAESACKKG